MAVTIETILAVFEERGLRNTRPRRLLAEHLATRVASTTDFSTDELWHGIKQLNPRLGRATVYRVVEVLLKEGLLDRVEFGDGTHRYRICGEHHHHHVTCTRLPSSDRSGDLPARRSICGYCAHNQLCVGGAFA